MKNEIFVSGYETTYMNYFYPKNPYGDEKPLIIQDHTVSFECAGVIKSDFEDEWGDQPHHAAFHVQDAVLTISDDTFSFKDIYILITPDYKFMMDDRAYDDLNSVIRDMFGLNVKYRENVGTYQEFDKRIGHQVAQMIDKTLEQALVPCLEDLMKDCTDFAFIDLAAGLLNSDVEISDTFKQRYFDALRVSKRSKPRRNQLQVI
ncbi:hypothetical protein ACMXYX_18140 (plasmid) [Neptuniibacter sp. QD72_48]|uniref:hypothetical protein n=1 Tax=Neptuniibacter sp. QD72_48 TaxID=3398214 RepID=UPI0039F44B5E